VTPLTPSSAAPLLERSAVIEEGSHICRLTKGLAAGEEDAFREFHSAYFDRLLRYLIVVTHGDEEAALEALQETLIRVVRHARAFDNEDTFWSWLTVLARSAAVDGGRKRSRYWRLLASYARWQPLSAPERPSEEKPDEHLHALLEDGLENLESVERGLVQGKYLRGASIRQLALEFHLTEKAVESRLLRARRQLREHLLRQLKNEKSK
jgi:RNA polymerase sigma-70 factor (ECF subfamily)